MLPNDISDINVINAGLTNVSFSFECCRKKYVYRHPGGTSDNLINRKTELFAQSKAKELGIDNSVIKMICQAGKFCIVLLMPKIATGKVLMSNLKQLWVIFTEFTTLMLTFKIMSRFLITLSKAISCLK